MRLNNSNVLFSCVSFLLIITLSTVKSLSFLEHETWWSSKFGVFIIIVSMGSGDPDGRNISTNPLSRLMNSTNPTLHSASNATTVSLNMNLNGTTEKEVNNIGGAYLNSSGVAKKTSSGTSNQTRRVGKRRRFGIKQFSPTVRKSRPYFHPTSSSSSSSNNMNNEMKKQRTRKGGQSLNFDEGLQAESLRMEILNRLGKVDSLSCLPKALCGVASMNSQKNFHNTMDDNLINNYLKIVQTVVPKNDVTGNQKKKTKKKKKKTKVRDNDLDSSEESVESNASSAEELSQDDLEHMREKARVEKWMRDDEDDPEPNWWDILPPNRPYHPIDEIPPNHYSDSGSWSSFSPFRVSKGLTSFFGSILPSISWGLGNKPDVFSDDPFFQEFRGFKGRSIGDDDKRSFSWLFGKSGAVGQTGGDIPTSGGGGALDTIHHRRGPDKISKRRNYKGKSSKNKNNRARKGHSNEEADNPAEKFQLAIEIGKQMEDPNECNFVFTGCPFSYLEIIEIIESSKKSAAQEIGQDDKQLNYLEIFGLGNNSDLSNTHYFPTTSDRLEINLKIADKNVATLIPHSSNLRNPDDDFTLEISTAPSNTNNLQVESQPPTDAINHHHAPLPTMFRTDVLQGESVNSNVGGGGSEDDSVEHNLIRPQTTINPKITKRRKSKGPARINTRQQWGSKHGLKLAPLVKHSSSPTILRQSQQLHTHTKYKHIPLPTTINKPSHVINYHFHNTNTHPQVSHNPQQLSVHSYPPPATPLNIQQPHYYTQQPVHQSTLSSTTVAAQTTPSTSSSGFRNDLKSKRHKKRRRNKPKRKRKNPVSEERIIIRLPEPTQQPNNNYYNLYPLLNNPTYNSPPPQQQSQADQQYHHHHQNQHYSHHIPHRHSSPQPTYFAPQHPGYQSHQSSYPFYPHSPLMPPGIFSYVLGKK